MGLEIRAGGIYFYDKERVNGRVVSRYIGSGQVALDCARLVRWRRQEQAAQRAAREQERAAGEALDAEISAACEPIAALERATLVAHGWHRHRGQWRRKQDEHGSSAGAG